VRHRDRNEWELELLAAAPRDWRSWSLIERTEPIRNSHGEWRIREQRRPERRRVTILREVPHRRNLLKDDDNRAFCVKPLYDALKALGLIYDDASRWVERELREDPTGRDYTTIRIDRLA
jgi:hypothetical protein